MTHPDAVALLREARYWVSAFCAAAPYNLDGRAFLAKLETALSAPAAPQAAPPEDAELKRLRERLAECRPTENDCEPNWRLERVARDAIAYAARLRAAPASEEVVALLKQFQHLLHERLYWVYNTCAPMKNSVGMQSVANELFFKVEDIIAALNKEKP